MAGKMSVLLVTGGKELSLRMLALDFKINSNAIIVSTLLLKVYILNIINIINNSFYFNIEFINLSVCRRTQANKAPSFKEG